jgi:hypothetical protein
MAVGYMLLFTKGKLQRVTMRLVLYDALLKGTAITSEGTISFAAFVNAGDLDRTVIIMELNATGGEAAGGAYVQYFVDNSQQGGNPSPIPFQTQDSIYGSQQPIRTGGSYAAAIKTKEPTVIDKDTTQQLIYLSVSCTIYRPKSNISKENSIEWIRQAESLGPAYFFKQHQQWWHNYWNLSFLSIPLTFVEGFYWIQMYRFASLGRAAIPDLMGPWGPGGINLCLGPWCQYVWDMNEQVMMWPIPASNRLVLGQPMVEQIQTFLKDGLWGQLYGSNGMPDGSGGIWMLHNYWKMLAYSGKDRDSMEMKIFLNLLKKAMNPYLDPNTHILWWDGNYYHVLNCESPEYDYKPHNDCNYDLALLRWAFPMMIKIATEFKFNEPELPIWKHILSRLVPYPTDKNGYRISADQPFAKSHRHFSHLLMIYDLETDHWAVPDSNTKPKQFANSATDRDKKKSEIKLKNNVYLNNNNNNNDKYLEEEDNESILMDNNNFYEQQNLNEVMEISLDHWYNLTCWEQQWKKGFKEQCRGFTQAGMSCMSAVMRRADAALGNLTALLNSVILPNAQYGEEVFAGNPSEFAPVAESAFAAAQSLHPILLQSQGGLIRIFPAAPISTLGDVVFHQLRTEGAFLVSAVRERGITKFIYIKSEAGRQCLVQVDGWNVTKGNPSHVPHAVPAHVLVKVVGNIRGEGSGWFEVGLKKGESVLLWMGTKPPAEFVIRPLKGNPAQFNYYGYRWPVPSMH